MPASHGVNSSAARRIDRALRLITALPLGYAVATLWSMAIARLLPMRADEATGVGMLSAFLICPSIAMWAFAAQSGWRAMRPVLALGAVAGAIVAIAITTGGRV